MKRFLFHALAATGLGAACTVLVPGCATCSECRGDEVRSTPQSAGWQNVDGGVPVPVRPSLRVPARDFATPPIDAPDVPRPVTPTPVTPTPNPPQPPAPVPAPAPNPPEPPAPAPAPRLNGHARMTTTKETEGASVIIEQHAAGTIVVNSPGATPGAPAAAAPQPEQAFPLVPVIAAVASNPQVVSTLGMVAKRVGGGLYYTATGKCPKSDPAPAPFVAMVPQQSYAAVPIQMVAQAAPVAPQMVLMAPAPAPAPQQYLQATPQYAVPAAPVAPKKCRVFGR